MLTASRAGLEGMAGAGGWLVCDQVTPLRAMAVGAVSLGSEDDGVGGATMVGDGDGDNDSDGDEDGQ